MAPRRSTRMKGELYDDDKYGISFDNDITELLSSARRLGSQTTSKPELTVKLAPRRPSHTGRICRPACDYLRSWPDETFACADWW